jgi:SAM-dependent methyltransferase
VSEAAYDRIGIGYRQVRRPDPRIADRIEAVLGDARSVVNVGAGSGSYEPTDREVTAVEPSRVMIEQRPVGAAPAVQANAEALPFEDGSFDAAMALVTVHHWPDPLAGVGEMVRVARRRVAVLSFDPAPMENLWLCEYFPRAWEIHRDSMPPVVELAAAMGPGATIEAVPIPSRFTDGFFCALWDRPELHLDPLVRRASSVWHAMTPEQIDGGLAALRADLASGAWDERYGELRGAAELDVGMRLVSANGREPA